MTKKLKFLLLALLLAFGLGLFYSQKTPQPQKKESAQTQAAIIIDYSDGKKESASFVPQSGQTAFDALKVLAEEKNISLETQQYDFGVFVRAIGGYPSSSEHAWIYFVNGTAGVVASDQQEIKPGDIVEWRYTKPE